MGGKRAADVSPVASRMKACRPYMEVDSLQPSEANESATFEVVDYLIDLNSPEARRIGKVGYKLWAAVELDIAALLIRPN